MMAENLKNCLAYLSKIPPAVSGSGGHAATLRAAAECIRFNLSEAEAWEAMTVYNKRCSPPWTEKELAHKLESARRKAQPGERVRMAPQPRTPARPQVKPRTAAELRAVYEAARNRAASPTPPPATCGAQPVGRNLATCGAQPSAAMAHPAYRPSVPMGEQPPAVFAVWWETERPDFTNPDKCSPGGQNAEIVAEAKARAALAPHTCAPQVQPLAEESEAGPEDLTEAEWEHIMADMPKEADYG